MPVYFTAELFRFLARLKRNNKRDWFLAHQANQRINEYVREKLGVPVDKMPMNIDRFGNTSAASIPIAYDEVRRQGLIQDGGVLVMVAFGAGLTWGSAVIRETRK